MVWFVLCIHNRTDHLGNNLADVLEDVFPWCSNQCMLAGERYILANSYIC